MNSNAVVYILQYAAGKLGALVIPTFSSEIDNFVLKWESNRLNKFFCTVVYDKVDERG